MNRLTRYALGLLVEEMGEALQIIGKALRFGLDAPGPNVAPYHGRTARQLLSIEMGDVAAAQSYGVRARILQLGGLGGIEARRAAKLERLLDPESVDSNGHQLAPDPTIEPVAFTSAIKDIIARRTGIDGSAAWAIAEDIAAL